VSKTCGFDLQAEPFFYRTRSGLEVDLLMVTPGGVICAELKAREAASVGDHRGSLLLSS
jgi:hypothetical protein